MPLRQLISCALLGLSVLLVSGLAVGSSDENKAGPRGSVNLVIEITDRSDLEILTRMVSIDDVEGHQVRAVATPEQLDKLSKAGWVWRVAPTAPKTSHLTMCGEGWVENPDRLWTCYPTYQQYEALLQYYASSNPELCRLVDLGSTANLNRPHRLWALVISDHPGEEEIEPEVLLKDPEITALVDGTEIWINPLANPDGTYFGGDDTVADAIRFYTTSAGDDSGVNANRNFPDFDGGDHPDGNAWWPETEAMMALAEAGTFVLSANFHDGAEVVNYPWDTVARNHPDDLWFRDLSLGWAMLAQTDGPTGYMTGVSNNGITNGYDWYRVLGGRQDFMTYFHGGREVTIELSETKLLPAEELDDMWQWNRRALLDFLGRAHLGIRGVVTDANGAPLEASVEVVGVDRAEDGSTVRTDADVGDYHRLLLPGLYDLRIEAPDFEPTEVHGVAVVDGEATRVDIVLHRLIRRPTDRTEPIQGHSSQLTSSSVRR
jgi:hypothetical protein